VLPGIQDSGSLKLRTGSVAGSGALWGSADMMRLALAEGGWKHGAGVRKAAQVEARADRRAKIKSRSARGWEGKRWRSLGGI
jgi:hypothetical protein